MSGVLNVVIVYISAHIRSNLRDKFIKPVPQRVASQAACTVRLPAVNVAALTVHRTTAASSPLRDRGQTSQTSLAARTRVLLRCTSPAAGRFRFPPTAKLVAQKLQRAYSPVTVSPSVRLVAPCYQLFTRVFFTDRFPVTAGLR
jgi:hypothetical protein